MGLVEFVTPMEVVTTATWPAEFTSYMVAFRVPARFPGAPLTVTQRLIEPVPLEFKSKASGGLSVKLRIVYLRLGLV